MKIVLREMGQCLWRKHETSEIGKEFLPTLTVWNPGRKMCGVRSVPIFEERQYTIVLKGFGEETGDLKENQAFFLSIIDLNQSEK
jgi:hypothetical protein